MPRRLWQSETMHEFHTDIEQDAIKNEAFRRVLFTGKGMQLVVMSLKPNEEIGSEIHEDNEQFFRIETGKARFVIEGNTLDLDDGSVVIVPAGVRHNVINSSSESDLKLYTIYSPPHHPDGTVHLTKADAEAAE